MYEHTAIDTAAKADFYQSVAEQARHLVEGEPNAIANLSNVSALLNVHLENINWVGFYLWDEAQGDLVLGPFQGKPACIRIALGKGVCGTAMQSGKSVVVSDVHQFPGHIACDADSRSEVVVPIFRGDRKIGVLDIDAPIPARFTEEDARGLEQVVQVLLQHANL